MVIWVISCTDYNLAAKNVYMHICGFNFWKCNCWQKKLYVTVPPFTLRKFMTRAGWRCKDLPALQTSSKGTLQGASEGPSNPIRLWSQLALFHGPWQGFNPLVHLQFSHSRRNHSTQFTGLLWMNSYRALKTVCWEVLNKCELLSSLPSSCCSCNSGQALWEPQ